ncbi:MAG: DUF72 domain-containing protein [Acidobacteria bacterium]|nr:MAG: DUF72 domain-containing protein [Acidobacteriota bacterium]
MNVELPPNLRLGTSSWSTTDWYEVFYPPELHPGEFITYYARHFDTVEIDATFYRPPTRQTVESWAKRTPDGFLFSAKVPREITHQKYLLDCQSEMISFLQTMSALGEKLGPLLLQFPYVAKRKDAHEYQTGDEFRRRLAPFLASLPTSDYRFAVEVRNAHWLGPSLTALLAEHGVALALSCYYTLPSLDEVMAKIDVVTADFSYIRFIGHRRRMDELIDRLMREEGKPKRWNELVVDRRDEMERWMRGIRQLVARGLDVFVYFNNHYAGFAPGSAALFKTLWLERTEGSA